MASYNDQRQNNDVQSRDEAVRRAAASEAASQTPETAPAITAALSATDTPKSVFRDWAAI
ncbi:hypothetical protein [Maritimibacter sp. DP1N21-5]|uniref:hypothetical protein n=1 Tax=Maritimibacter sp. DP1N21-5 TaxID=2836867 RepID=UPI001C48E94E|nr:hypothetical protein [Maritimibacter sp. DP1N21-5]MBV7409614.1 hypothetical protein [Maritimibacter sp. DP1N21-5]